MRFISRFNPLFIEGTSINKERFAEHHQNKVSIPYSSGHFDQPSVCFASSSVWRCFNPLFIGALRSTTATTHHWQSSWPFPIPYSSGHFDQLFHVETPEIHAKRFQSPIHQGHFRSSRP